MKDSSIKQNVNFIYKQAPTAVYCRYCGKPLIGASTSEDGSVVNPQWEFENKMHYSCYQIVVTEKQKVMDADPEEKRLKEPISDEVIAAAMAKHAKDNTDK